MPSPLQEFKLGAKCPHCNNGDWCYRVGDLTVCNRGADWIKASRISIVIKRALSSGICIGALELLQEKSIGE